MIEALSTETTATWCIVMVALLIIALMMFVKDRSEW